MDAVDATNTTASYFGPFLFLVTPMPLRVEKAVMRRGTGLKNVPGEMTLIPT